MYLADKIFKCNCLDISCVTTVGLIIGGYNQDWNHEEVFLTSTELYSIVGPSRCNYTLPDLPVGMKGMFGGWVGGQAVVCGGEGQEGIISQFCFYYNPEGGWVLNKIMEVGRSFAATEVVDGCLVITGGQTMVGITDTVEVIGGNKHFKHMKFYNSGYRWQHLFKSQRYLPAQSKKGSLPGQSRR